jgi:hypothetical protein
MSGMIMRSVNYKRVESLHEWCSAIMCSRVEKETLKGGLRC